MWELKSLAQFFKQTKLNKMERYDNLFQAIERLTGKMLLQTEMDEIVAACEPLNGITALRAKVEILQGAYDTAKDHANALNAENARLRDALEGVLRVANVRIDDQRIAQFDAARTALNSTQPDPLYTAAPEMLKALEMIENLQSKTRICFDASDAESMWDTLQEVFIIASNPIAKLYKAI